MEQQNISARHILEVRGSLVFLSGYFIITLLAVLFQVLAGQKIETVGFGLVVNVLILVFSFLIYRAKKAGKSAAIASWTALFLMLFFNVTAKYVYAMRYDWTYAAESYHISAITVATIILVQFLYSRRLYAVMVICVFISWLVFLFMANSHGVEFYMYTYRDGKVYHGMMFLREVYYFVIMLLISVVVYFNIPSINEFDRRTKKQHEIIVDQAKTQSELAEEVNENVGELFQRLEQQKLILEDFSDRMQDQASTFEEISATLEELQGSAESIAVSAASQMDENSRMNSTLKNINTLKKTTRASLDETSSGIGITVENSRTGKEMLDRVEKSVSDLNAQNTSITETVNLITDIADKINLLALNASIEAARAGEHGRGFAVVADEIGKLAVQTADSVKLIVTITDRSSRTMNDTRGVINSTIPLILEMISNMEKSSGSLNELRKSIELEEREIAEMLSHMERAGGLSKSIATGTDEQKRAIENTNSAIETVNEAIGTMVRGIDEIVNSSKKIIENAAQLRDRAGASVSGKTGIS